MLLYAKMTAYAIFIKVKLCFKYYVILLIVLWKYRVIKNT